MFKSQYVFMFTLQRGRRQCRANPLSLRARSKLFSLYRPVWRFQLCYDVRGKVDLPPG